MVFSSFPTYPDSSNWQQQNHPITSTVGFTGNNNNNINQQFLPHHPLPPQPHQTPPPLHHNGNGGSGGPGGPGGLIRPGSMAERARLANIPLPETALKCPRCDSTNTKFCYFNNYSLSQPRHFCKSCRRYWTRGGALRSVPVGGGCRRNKRTKNSSGGSSSSGTSKSQDSTTSNDQYHRAMTNNPMGPPSSSPSLSSLLSSYNAGLIPGHDHNNNNNNILGLGSSLPPLKLMPPLDFTDNFALQYGPVSAPSYHIGGGSSGGSGGGGAAALLTGFDQWRFPATHQLPLLGGGGLDQFDHDQHQMEQQNTGYGLVTGSGQYRPRNIFHNLISSSSSASSAMVTATASQLASVKMEDSNNQLNLSRHLFGNEQQLWNVHGTAASTAAATTSSWSDVSNNFSSSSTSNI